MKTTTLNKKASQEEDEDDYENDPWDEGSSKKIAKKDVFDLKTAKNNIPLVKDEESEEDDMVALPLPTKKREEDNGLFVDNDFGDDFSEEEEEKPEKKNAGHDIFDKQRPS